MALLSCGVVDDHRVDLTPLPTHNYSRITNHGFDDVVFRLVLEDGCLRGQGYESKNFPVPGPVLLVWPSGYRASTYEGTYQVKSTSGEVMAYLGAEVRLSGMFLSKDSVLDIRQDMAESQNCEGPYFLVGDEVSVVGQDEPLILSIPEIGLRFQREESWRWTGGREIVPRSPVNGQVVLKDGCLLISHSSKQGTVESEIVWPAGFHPHLGEDRLEVRNGGGKTIVRPGDHIVVIGNSGSRRVPYTDDGCSEKAWKIRRIEDDGARVELLRYDCQRTLSRWSGLMFTSGVTLIPTLSCQDKENAVYTTESHDNGIATLTEARRLEGV